MKYAFYITLLCVLFAACKQKVKQVFEKIDPEDSGITFSNTLIESDTLNILDYLYFYNGAGVASADFNNDGLEDLYFVSNQSSNKLYLNKGKLKFEDITQKAGVGGKGNWKTGVTVVDINSDGFKDIYVSVVSGYKNFKGKNQLYMNNGDLTFTESAAKWGVDFSGLATQASFFDYDKDGDLDLFILTHSVHNNDTYGDSTQRFKYSHAAGDHLLRNEGNRFVDVTQQSGIYAAPIGYGLGLSIGDLNNDGWDDIYVSNDFFEQDYYYINQKNGTFKEKFKDAFGHTSLFSMGNTLADFNKDGCLDVVTTDMLPEDMKALKSSINDEPLDVYNLEVKNGYYYQYSKNTLQLNVANGEKFVDIALYAGVAATDWTWSPLVQDFDMDGRKDMFFSNGIKKRLTDLDYLKYLGSPGMMKMGQDRIFDWDKINRMPDGRVHNYLYRGDSTLKFTDVSFANDMEDLSSSAGAVAVDLDNDGDLEIVTNNIDQPAFVYKNKTVETDDKLTCLKYKVQYTKGNPDGIGTKFFLKSKNGVDHQEVQTTTAFQSNLSLNQLFTFSKEDNPLELLIVWPDNSYQLIKDFKMNSLEVIRFNKAEVQSAEENIADIISDFIKDKKQFDSKTIQASLLSTLKTNETPDFNYYSLLPHTYLPPVPAVAVADVNQDGWEDVYVGGIAGEEKYMLLGNSAGDYKKESVPALKEFTEYGDNQAKFADVDNDGKQDLIVLSANHPFTDPDKIAQPRLYLNKGNLHFQYVALPKITTKASKIFLLDYNHDGLKDIFLSAAVSFGNYTGEQLSYLFINKGHGDFQQVSPKVYSDLAKIPFIKDMAIADIDKNGKEDIVIAAEWQPIQIFLNDGKQYKRWSSSLLNGLIGWWQSIIVIDIDQDGKLDLIAGNWGVNNKYNVGQEQPLYAYNNDLDNNGKNDLILSYYHQGKYYPFRPKNDLEQELPYLKKEWLSYLKMADKTTEEIFKDKLDNNNRLEANTFASVFISDVLNATKAQELPYQLQQAPILSIQALSNNELLINGNFWGVIPYEGKYDAVGLVTFAFDKQKKSFSRPQYWVNPQFNFEEVNYIHPIRKTNKIDWIILTCEGKLLLLSDKKESLKLASIN